jgi:hypothetical protein
MKIESTQNVECTLETSIRYLIKIAKDGSKGQRRNHIIKIIIKQTIPKGIRYLIKIAWAHGHVNSITSKSCFPS